jgi:hypothetical protein
MLRNQVNKKRIDKEAYALMGIIFILFYVSLETVLFGTNNNTFYVLVGELIYVAFALFSIFKCIQIRAKNITSLIFVVAFILLSAIANLDMSGGVLLQISAIIAGFYLSQRYSFSYFITCFDKLFYYLTLAGLIVWVVYLLLPSLFEVFPIIYNSGERYQFYCVGFTNMMTGAFSDNWRNALFFREPGVYTVFLIFALAINLFYFSKINKWRVIVYLIGILSTMSTAGYLLTMVLLPLYYISKGNVKGTLATVLFVLLLLFIYNQFSDSFLFDKVFDKLDSESDSYASSLSRKASFVLPFHICMGHPLFGAGLTGFSDEFIALSKSIYKTTIDPSGNAANTILDLAATYGAAVGVYLCLLLFQFAKKLKANASPILTLVLFIVLFGALSNEDIRYTAFIYALLFYGLRKNKMSLRVQ